MKTAPEQMMASALRRLLAPFARITDQTLERAYREQRSAAGLGRASPGEVLYARMALRAYEASRPGPAP